VLRDTGLQLAMPALLGLDGTLGPVERLHSRCMRDIHLSQAGLERGQPRFHFADRLILDLQR
jgi:hypothetical protein